ncbi:Polymer-forming protein, partial [Sporobacter termitidis DSM 10068]
STKRGDIRINGSGSTGGGAYDSVIIRGTGKVAGDLSCNVFQISGSGSVDGNLEVEDGKISGSGSIDGDLKAAKFRISGSGKIIGSVKAGEFIVSGAGTVLKGVEAQSVKIEGSAKIGLDCNAESFDADGGFEIGGLLNADEVKIRIYGMKSKVREIGGGKITVTMGPAHGFNIVRTIVSMGILNPALETDTIEGDEINLENTTAKVVRGNSVTIGSGCNIGLVEYKDHYTKSADARVGTETKI